MYVCLCNGITDEKLKKLITQEKICNIKDLHQHCRAGLSCGSCRCQVEEVIATHKPSSKNPTLSKQKDIKE